MELNQTRIEDAIVREVSDKIVGDEDLYGRVQRAVDDRINRLFKEVANDKIKSAIELAITQGFEHEYHKVDSFGQREGKPTTIRAELERMISGYWNEMVDKQGKPSSGYGANNTRAEWLMTQLVAADFKGEMHQHVVNLGGALKDKLRAELHVTVNRLLSEVIHVNSADDQAADRRGPNTIHPPQTPKAQPDPVTETPTT